MDKNKAFITLLGQFCQEEKLAVPRKKKRTK